MNNDATPYSTVLIVRFGNKSCLTMIDSILRLLVEWLDLKSLLRVDLAILYEDDNRTQRTKAHLKLSWLQHLHDGPIL